MRTFFKRILKKWKIRQARRLAESQKALLPPGIDRVYHVHIRKSAGTSINAAFWSLGGLQLQKMKRHPLVIGERKVFVRNNLLYIEAGYYLYGNSHIPVWNLKLPPHTFTFCMLRDPFERLVSLYKYYEWIRTAEPVEAIKQEPYYKNLLKQVHWVEEGFSVFLDRLPQKHLQNQLFMFSGSFDIGEALQRAGMLDRIYFQDHFDEAITDLSSVLGLPLEVKRERSFRSVPVEITEEEKRKALEMLKEEYDFYNRLRN